MLVFKHIALIIKYYPVSVVFTFLEKLFGRKSQTGKNVARVQEEKKLEYDFTTPGLSQTVTFGRNRDGEVAAVVLNRPEENIHKVIVNHSGRFEDFLGIIKGDWTACIVGNFNFEAGAVRLRTSFERHEDEHGIFKVFEISPYYPEKGPKIRRQYDNYTEWKKAVSDIENYQ